MLLMDAATTVSRVNVEVGARVQERRTRLGMSVSALAREAKVDRGRLAALEAGDGSVRESTIGAIHAALDRLEHEIGMDVSGSAVGTDPEDDLVEFTIEGNFGVRAVVKGPIRDMDKLQAAVARLVQEMKNGD